MIELGYGLTPFTEEEVIKSMTVARDYIYLRIEQSKSSDSKYTHSEMEYLRDTFNTLNAEMAFLNEEVKRRKALEAINDMPDGYDVDYSKGDDILVWMSSEHRFKDCAETIIYKGRKYRYGMIEPGLDLRRWYHAEK